MGDTSQEVVLAADGRPLKQSLRRALMRQKMRALMLVAPLLIFVVVTFIVPILSMLFRSVENDIVPNTIPGTVIALSQWDGSSGNRRTKTFTAIFTLIYSRQRKPNSTPALVLA